MKKKAEVEGRAAGVSGLVRFSDLVLASTIRVEDGKPGFEVWIGGLRDGVPVEAILFERFVPREEVAPLVLAMCRVLAREVKTTARLGRAGAVMKRVVDEFGLEGFRGLVVEERAKLSPDSGRELARITNYTNHVARSEEAVRS